MTENALYINWKAVTYKAIDNKSANAHAGRYCFLEDLCGREHPLMITPAKRSLRTFKAIAVPEGHYFMLGDNRDNSADSRYFGFVPRSCILGEATTVIASFDIHDHYKPRWKRFFSRLP